MRCDSRLATKKPELPAFSWLRALHPALSLRQRLDAFGAQRLADENTLFKHPHALEIRFEFVPGRAHGVAATVAEHRPLATHFTLRHDGSPRLVSISEKT